MKFKIFSINYFIFLLIISYIICQTSTPNFKVNGKIITYENTIATKVCCQGQCINLSSPNSSYIFRFNISTLGMGINIYI
jgi:hypothetical protein